MNYFDGADIKCFEYVISSNQNIDLMNNLFNKNGYGNYMCYSTFPVGKYFGFVNELKRNLI